MKAEPASRPDMSSRHRSALDALPSSVLFSSEALGWNQVNVQRRIRPQGGVTDVPDGMREHVVLVWHGATHVSSVLGGTRQEANASIGPTQFIPAKTPVSWERRSAFHFTKISLAGECVETLMVDLFDRDPDRSPLVPRALNDDAILREHARALIAHALSDDPTNPLVPAQIAQQLGVHLIETYGQLALRRSAARRLPARHLRTIVDYVETNLGGEITLDALAGLAYVSKYHFLRRFKRSTGMTPHQFVLQRRIQRARELILSERVTVAEAAQLTGFSDQAHLNRVFKKTVGVTPRAFKRRG